MIFRFPAPVRRLAQALAALQLATAVAVPLAEARLERPDEPVHVERSHGDDCATVHRPSACLLCQHAATRSHAAKQTALLPASAVSGFEQRGPRSHDLRGPARLEPPSTGPPSRLG